MFAVTGTGCLCSGGTDDALITVLRGGRFLALACKYNIPLMMKWVNYSYYILYMYIYTSAYNRTHCICLIKGYIEVNIKGRT